VYKDAFNYYETYKILTGKEKIESDQLFKKAATTELRGHMSQNVQKVPDLN